MIFAYGQTQSATVPGITAGWNLFQKQTQSTTWTMTTVYAIVGVGGITASKTQTPFSSGTNYVAAAEYTSTNGPWSTLTFVMNQAISASVNPPSGTTGLVTPANADNCAVVTAISGGGMAVIPTISGTTVEESKIGPTAGVFDTGAVADAFGVGTSSISYTVTYTAGGTGRCGAQLVVFYAPVVIEAFAGSITPTSTWGPTETFAKLSGSITAAGSLVKQACLWLVGSITASSAWSYIESGGGTEYFQSVSGSITATSSILKQTGALYSGSVTPG